MPSLSQQILRTDASGMPLEWDQLPQAARLHFLDMTPMSAASSFVHPARRHQRDQSPPKHHRDQSIVATHGNHQLRDSYTPPLSNRTLFPARQPPVPVLRPAFSHTALSRDHVTPISQGGLNHWGQCGHCMHPVQ